jgi:hypothetical protein
MPSCEAVLRRFTGPRGEILVDLRYAPLFMSMWRGELDLDMVEQLFAWTRERNRVALEELSQVAYLNHVDELHMVSGDVRRRISELSIDLHASGLREGMVGSWQVLSSPMLRGFLRAASWVTNGAVDGRVVGSWAEGIAVAVAALAREGVAVTVPGPYSFPLD